MDMTLAILIVLLNILAHFFLMRFFKWYNESSKEQFSALDKQWLKWFLLIPPIALIVAVLLIGLGLILQVFDRLKRKK